MFPHSNRSIKRIAFLQEYANKPWMLKELIPEVASKGYAAVAFSCGIGKEDFISELAKIAGQHNLEVMAFTGYMKYQQAYLCDHPQQRVVFSDDEGKDQDNVEINWGCPWNPEFKKRYFDFLTILGNIPNMSEVWINDEAYLGSDANKIGCYCSVCQTAWNDEFGREMPQPPFSTPEQKQRLTHWRFNRWNAVHAEMKQVLQADHPVRAIFLTSPGALITMNPWVSAIDFASMVRGIDGVMTDPYYTFHVEIARNFRPMEAYLSECCRMLNGICEPDKLAEICAQGFSHTTFTRPLDERDGLWSAIVPMALGIDGITSYTYQLQKISEVQSTYEKSFQLDKYFEQTKPYFSVGILNSLETQCYDQGQGIGNQSWMVSKALTISELLRNSGISYGYVYSREENEFTPEDLPILLLPNVSCLSGIQRSKLRKYVADGGVLIAFGQTATFNETGQRCDDGFLEELFGIKNINACGQNIEFEKNSGHFAFAELPWPDETTKDYMDGAYRPRLGLHSALRIDVSASSEVIAHFKEDQIAGEQPAITINSIDRKSVV